MVSQYNPAPLVVYGIDDRMRRTQHERVQRVTLVQRCNLADSWNIEWGDLSRQDREGWTSEFGPKSTPPHHLGIEDDGVQLASGYFLEGEQTYQTDAYGRTSKRTTATYSGALGYLWERHVWPTLPVTNGSGIPVFGGISDKNTYEPRSGTDENIIISLLEDWGNDYIVDPITKQVIKKQYLASMTSKDIWFDRYLLIPARTHPNPPGSFTNVVYPALRKVGEVISEVAERGRLRVDIQYAQNEVDPRREFGIGGVWKAKIEPFRDLSDTIRFGMAYDAAVGVVNGYRRTFKRQTMTLPIGITETERFGVTTISHATLLDAQKYGDATEEHNDLTFMGPVIEEIIEAGDSSVEEDRIKAREEAHTRFVEGRAQLDFEFSVTLPPHVKIGRDLRPGDIVGVDFLSELGGDKIEDSVTSVVREITTEWVAGAAPKVTLKVGDSNESLNQISTKSILDMRRRVNRLSRK